jgi:Lrp/AsnC family leucine-responsive transcriptional regulator
MSRRIDQFDRQIVRLLRQNGRMSDAEIGHRIGKSPNVVRLRRQKLELLGVIERYTIYVSDRLSSYDSFFYVLVSLRSNNRDVETIFEKAMSDDLDVLFCDSINGDYDYMIYFGSTEGRDIDQFGSHLRSMPFVESANCIRRIGATKNYNIDPDRLLSGSPGTKLSRRTRTSRK